MKNQLIICTIQMVNPKTFIILCLITVITLYILLLAIHTQEIGRLRLSLKIWKKRKQRLFLQLSRFISTEFMWRHHAGCNNLFNLPLESIAEFVDTRKSLLKINLCMYAFLNVYYYIVYLNRFMLYILHCIILSFLCK